MVRTDRSSDLMARHGIKGVNGLFGTLPNENEKFGGLILALVGGQLHRVGHMLAQGQAFIPFKPDKTLHTQHGWRQAEKEGFQPVAVEWCRWPPQKAVNAIMLVGDALMVMAIVAASARLDLLIGFMMLAFKIDAIDLAWRDIPFPGFIHGAIGIERAHRLVQMSNRARLCQIRLVDQHRIGHPDLVLENGHNWAEPCLH